MSNAANVPANNAKEEDGMSNIEEHSPGPWRAAYFGGRQCVLHYDHGDATIVAEMDNPVDARLMAASPDMKKALRLFVAHYPHGINPYLDQAYSEARDALTKVGG
jgi:hypothetical protein